MDYSGVYSGSLIIHVFVFLRIKMYLLNTHNRAILEEHLLLFALMMIKKEKGRHDKKNVPMLEYSNDPLTLIVR